MISPFQFLRQDHELMRLTGGYDQPAFAPAGKLTPNGVFEVPVSQSITDGPLKELQGSG
jgi:hypothetical protein